MPTYTHPYVYIRFNGVFGNTATPIERWSAGIKLLQPGGLVATNSLIAFLETISGPVATFHSHSAVKAGQQCWLTELTAAVVGTDGKYIGGGAQTTLKRPYTTPVAGAATTILPYPTSMVLSLRTTLQRGRASNGRVYWPATALNISPTTGVVVTADTTNYATQAALLLNAINQAADAFIPDSQGIWVMSGLDAGTSAPVTSVRIGGRMDHQESRERSIVEQYSSATVNSVPTVLERFRDLNVGEVQDLSGV